MATNRNGNGMRILWIPGRKRHNRKGQVEPTKKQVDYNRIHKQSQQWSLGGNRNHAHIMSGSSSLVDVAPVAGYASVKALQQSDSAKLHNQIVAVSKEENCVEECKSNHSTEEDSKEFESLENVKKKNKDDKIVNYIYYTLMCCECSIS